MPLEKVTITQIYRGTAKTQYGDKPKVAIKTTKHGDSWVSSFQVTGTEGWKERDVVEIDIYEKQTPKGNFLNFKLPSNDVTREEFNSSVQLLNELVTRIKACETAINKLQGSDLEPPSQVTAFESPPDFY